MRAAESSAYQALSDHDGDVHQAAINAITNGRLRSDRLKSALPHIVGNDNEDVTIKRNALQALTQFSLTNGEQAIYRQASAEVERMENSQAPVAAELMGGLFAVSTPAAAMWWVRAGERPTSANQPVLHYDHGVLVAEIGSVPLGTVLNELSHKSGMQIRLADLWPPQRKSSPMRPIWGWLPLSG